MILPDKNIKFSYSIINCGAIILSIMNENETVSALWEKAKNNKNIFNYDKFVMTLDFLFLLGVIDYKNGLIMRCSNDKKNIE